MGNISGAFCNMNKCGSIGPYSKIKKRNHLPANHVGNYYLQTRNSSPDDIENTALNVNPAEIENGKRSYGIGGESYICRILLSHGKIEKGNVNRASETKVKYFYRAKYKNL
jgi:hypothetical protein